MTFEDLQVKKIYITYLIRRSLKCANSQCATFSTEKQITKACSWIHPGILLGCTFYTHHLMAVLNNLNHRQCWFVKPVSYRYTIRFDNCYSYPAEKTSMGFNVGQPTIFLMKLFKKPSRDTSIQNSIYYW